MSHKKVIKKQKKQQKQKAPEIGPKKKEPLMEGEGKFFQELVNASNRYTQLLKQKAQYEFIIKKLQEDRKKIQHGDIPLPMTMTLIPKLMSYQEYDKKKILKIFDDQIKSYDTNIKTLNGQIEHRYEDYMESAVRNREFLNVRFKDVKAKNIVPLRDIAEKDEEVLFEAEFSDLLKDEEKQKELKEAKKEAIKRNIARKTKA